MSLSSAIEAFLASGEIDPSWSAWSGDRARGERTIRRVLERILAHRATGAPLGRRLPPADAGQVLVARVGPLLQGLLPATEATRLQGSLPSRLRVVTVDGFAAQTAELPLDDTWCLANIVLEDMGAPPLSDHAPQLDGLCIADHVWVPSGAFGPPTDTIDVLVHEVAHLLHTVDRSALGCAGTGPLVDVDPQQVETFAYACELWACRSRRPAGSWPELRDAVDGVRMADARVDAPRLFTALQAATTHGWAALRQLTRDGAAR